MKDDILGGIRLDELFPPGYRQNPFPSLCEDVFAALGDLMADGDLPRVPGWAGSEGYEALLGAYGDLPPSPAGDTSKLVRSMAADLLAGAVNWRCPDVAYNLGAPVNVAAAVLYAAALDVNVYLINDGLAGNAVVAEQAVGRILSRLAGLPPGVAHGIFVFGGTGTMAYALKAGLRKVEPASAHVGVPAGVKVMVTEDAHFSHATAADWLGVGSDDLLVVPAALHDRRSRLDAAEGLLRDALDAGYHVPTILLNGGTTYDHTVDDIPGFVELRDRLVADYRLPYRPHVHVDSVVGWAWLMFSGYDFVENPLAIGEQALDLIRRQHGRIGGLAVADSWGIDFHKGVGACPIDSSVVMFNDRADLVRLSKGGGPTTAMHQLADDFSAESPVDYTLETSRSGGKALAALASLHSLGQDGYRILLANLIENTVSLRAEIGRSADMGVLNPRALGYQTMVRLYPPDAVRDNRRNGELVDAGPDTATFVDQVNRYVKAFFAWDNSTRMDRNDGGVLYSFSRKYVRTPSGADISGLKFYPTSPRVSRSHIEDAVALLRARKAEFDARNAPGCGCLDESAGEAGGT